MGETSESADISTDCSICIGTTGPFQAIFIAPCCHVFHYKCALHMLAKSTMFQCPMCRAVGNLTASVSVEDVSNRFERAKDLPRNKALKEMVLEAKKAAKAEKNLAKLEAANDLANIPTNATDHVNKDIKFSKSFSILEEKPASKRKSLGQKFGLNLFIKKSGISKFEGPKSAPVTEVDNHPKDIHQGFMEGKFNEFKGLGGPTLAPFLYST